MRTVCRGVFKPTVTSRRITGSANGFSSSRKRRSSAVGAAGAPTEAVPRKTSVPSRFTMRISTWLSPSLGLAASACTSSPAKTALR
jgi:hypothetical protein